MNILVTRHYFQSWYIKSMMQKLSFIYQLCMFYFRQYLFKNQGVGMYPCFFFVLQSNSCNVTSILALAYRVKQQKSLQSFAKRTHWSQQTLNSNNIREDSTHGHHQMVNTMIRLIIFFAAKDGEALYSQQKQDRELTVAQIRNSLLPNSDLN